MARDISQGELHRLRGRNVVVEKRNGEVIEGIVRNITINIDPRIFILEQGGLSPFTPSRLINVRLSEIQLIEPTP